MSVVIFVLGRPGSGKSCAYRHICKLAHPLRLSVYPINDYTILTSMFIKDKDQKCFVPISDKKGFTVKDFTALDTALIKSNKQLIKNINKASIIIVELARDDYAKALSYFSSTLLKQSFFLFIKTDLEMCIKRIEERTMHPVTKDDYYVSPEILHNYYEKQIIPDLATIYGISEKQIITIDNNGSEQEFGRQVEAFVNSMLPINSRVQILKSRLSFGYPLQRAFGLSMLALLLLIQFLDGTQSLLDF